MILFVYLISINDATQLLKPFAGRGGYFLIPEYKDDNSIAKDLYGALRESPLVYCGRVIIASIIRIVCNQCMVEVKEAKTILTKE